MIEQHRRRVGSVRPSHLMFTSGVGALVDLPNFSVLVRGLDDWDFSQVGTNPVAEARLLDAVRSMGGLRTVTELRSAPWRPPNPRNNNDPAARIGVPTIPFPAWLRCTACNELASIDSRVFGFENDRANRPQDARFFHDGCGRKRPLAVAARFLLACTNGHLDDFPYVHFVHRGAACPKALQPRLRMEDRGGNIAANVTIRCINCGQRRNVRDALGRRGAENLPACRGRHPHLSYFDPNGCSQSPKLLVVGASNQWFAQTLSVLAVPPTDAAELDQKIGDYWDQISPLPKSMYPYGRANVTAFRELERWSDDEIEAAVERVRQQRSAAKPAPSNGYPDLLTPEWEIFSADQPPEVHDDFALRRDPAGVPAELKDIYSDVVQAERLREVRALVGFTRLDAPDPEDPTLVTPVSLSRDKPTWVPASEVRGEGIFLRVPDDMLDAWVARVEHSAEMRAHQEAYARFTTNRYSDRIGTGSFNPMKHWPGCRYLPLHTLSHLLIRTIALECGYNSASLSERIYAGTDDDPRSGILIYTAVPDAEGTLGGLVSLAEPENLVRLTKRALAEARHCSSDPLCAERLPHEPADFLHGAACHVCLFVSETTCERGNRFLDRRFVVGIDRPELALFGDVQ